jgi:hypothetical protein
VDTDGIVSGRVFKYQWGKEKSEVIDWNILEESEDVDLGMSDMEDHTVTDEIQFDYDTTMSQILFYHIFPSILRHDKLMGDYFSDPKADFHDTVRHDKIMFHGETDDDPDYKVHQCYTVLPGCRVF